MSKRHGSRNLGLKMIAGSAAGAVLSLGLCQVGFYLERNIHDGAPGWLDTIGGIVFLASILGVFVGILVAVIEAIGKIGKPKDDQ